MSRTFQTIELAIIRLFYAEHRNTAEISRIMRMTEPAVVRHVAREGERRFRLGLGR